MSRELKAHKWRACCTSILFVGLIGLPCLSNVPWKPPYRWSGPFLSQNRNVSCSRGATVLLCCCRALLLRAAFALPEVRIKRPHSSNNGSAMLSICKLVPTPIQQCAYSFGPSLDMSNYICDLLQSITNNVYSSVPYPASGWDQE